MWDMDANIKNQEEIRQWHSDNRTLGTFLSMCTIGAAKKYLKQFKPKTGMMWNGIVAWRAMVIKYRNPSMQRQRILGRKLTSMKMENDQDPDSYFNDMAELRDELEALGTTYNDNQILAVILDGLPEKYSGIKYEADTRDDFDLERAKYTMRNIYSNRKDDDRSSQPSNGPHLPWSPPLP